MICTGCGHELPAQASRGRPARFHDATCRQRAHRARRASHHHGVLAAITDLEAAVSELRRAVLTGGDTTETSHRLTRAAATVEQLLHAAAPSTSPPPAAEEPVAKSVTEPGTELAAREPSTPARAPATDPTPRPEPVAARPFRSVTKPITKEDRPPPIDPASVRVERNTNDSAGPRWRVLAGDADNPTVIGFATAGYTSTGNRSSSRWKAIATGGLVLRKDARSRAHAVAVVLDSYLRVAGVRPKLLS
jgi:hypothetical protein